MKKVIENIKSISIPKLDGMFVYLISATIPLTVSLGNITIIVAFVYSILTFKYRYSKTYKKYFIVLLVPALYFLMIFLSAIFSNDLKTGFVLVDKSLFFLLLPYLLVSLSDHISIYKVLKVFAISTFLSTLSLIFYSGFKALSNADINYLFFHEFTKLFDQHPVYYSTFQALSIFIITKYFPPTIKRKFLSLIMISCLLLGIFLSASKVVILIFTMLYIIQLMALIGQKKIRPIIVSLFIITVLSLLFIPSIKIRFLDGFSFDLNFIPSNDVAIAKVFNYDDKHLISDLEIRYIFNSIGVYHFMSDGKFLFGYGVGDVQDYLDMYYMQYGLAPNWFEGYNIHNQYLQVLLSTGLLGLLYFLAYLSYLCYLALKYKNHLHLMFIIILLFIFLSESVLMRNKGIILFVFFSSIFVIQNLKNENSHIRNKRYTKLSRWF